MDGAWPSPHRPPGSIPSWALALCGLLALSGCATGRDGNGQTHHDAGIDASAARCVPACEEGFTCDAGRCVPDVDADSDGIPGSRDCDDYDATVGATAERACTSGCGEGVERCSGGVWAACDAPTSCDCDPGSPPRMTACGMCGQIQQNCVDGRWVGDGECHGRGSCEPGTVEAGGDCGNCGTQSRTCLPDCSWGAWACSGMGECERGTTSSETRSCGSCGGSQTGTRTCTADCHWSATEWGSCSATGVCTAGQTETRTVTCGNCDRGHKTQTRTCSSSCTWGSWSDSSSCTGAGTCAPGATRSCANGDSCGVERCSASCTWGGCVPKSGAQCVRIGRSGVDGSNFRCCTPGGGGAGWQFCLATCQWSTACEAHSCD